MAPSTQLAVREKVDGAMAVFRDERARAELEATLPAAVPVAKFEQVVRTALLDDVARQRDPAKMLVTCDPASLYQAAVKCALDGLLPDGREAALVKRGASVAYQPMVGGFRKIAAEHGWDLKGRAVHANDTFAYTEEPETISHTPTRPGADPGSIVAAYAVARHRDGRRRQLVMTLDDIKKRRAKATTQAVWSEWEQEMTEKTPVRALFADLPFDPADKDRVLRVVQAADLEPGQAAQGLYGPASFGALPAGVSSEDPHPVAEPGEEGGTRSPAESGVEPAPAGDAEAGSADDDFAGDAGDPVDEALEAAQAAASYVAELPNPNNWAHGLTLAEIRADDRHDVFFRWALAHPKAPAELKQRAAAYARVQLPDLFAAVNA